MAQVPYGAEYVYHIHVAKYGYVHNTGTEVTLTPIKNGEEPSGWNTLVKDFKRAAKEVYSMWVINDEFGYH
jgi:hypothetical protein